MRDASHCGLSLALALIEVHGQSRTIIVLAGSRLMTTLVSNRGQKILRTTPTGTSPEGCHWSHTLSVIPLRSSCQFDPTVPCCIVCLTAVGTSAILSTPGRRRGTWSGSAATYVTCGSRSQRCSEIKPTALPSPSPVGFPQFSARPMPGILAARTPRACGMRCAWR